jgi:CRP-like cAMP-binding protein
LISELEIPAEELRRVDLRAGDVLFRQGDEADGLYIVAAGSLGVYARLPGGGESALAVLGAGEVVGELALVDGGTRAATVRALEPTAVHFFSRADFLAHAARLDPAAFALKRRLVAVVCSRLRSRLGVLRNEVDPGTTTRGGIDAGTSRAPDERYLVRLPFFRAFSQLQLPELLAACETIEVPARTVLLAEDETAEVAYVTLNGAVEEVLGGGRRRIRVRLAGPGHAVAYIGLLDGEPSPVTVATRERALLLAIPAATFTRMFEGETALSYAFVEAVQRDLIAALRQAERPQARLAAAQQASLGGRSPGTSASVTSRNERANSTNR